MRKCELAAYIVIFILFITALVFSSLYYRTPDTTTSYTVQPGDTVWGIAEKFCPNSHTGNVAFKINKLNDIGGYIHPGDELTVPCEPVVMEATAYTWTGNRTATGTWPSRGTIAVDPEVIPLGTKLYIEGYGPAVAEDTGGAIKGNIVDLYMETVEECWQFGRQKVEVVIE